MILDIRALIAEELTAVLTDAGKAVPPLRDSSALLAGDLGLDSMDFAVLVVRLEQKLHCDPFNSASLERFPTTFLELVELYQKTVAANASPTPEACVR